MIRHALAAAAAIALTGCAPKVAYVKPATPAPAAAFKENADWKTAQPRDQMLRGAWWDLFADPQLAALESQVDISNESLRAAQARFFQARAVIGVNHAALAPQVTVNPSITGVDPSGNRPTTSATAKYADFVLPADVSYEADVWGRVRASVAAARAAAQASAADVESVRLSVHAELAADYFQLRGVDAEQQLLDTAVAAFTRALELTQNRFRGGIASEADVAQAETQLETTRAQAQDLAVGRAQLEHAIAVLVGRPASTFSLAPLPLTMPPPPIPAGVPSDLLERRPDIAAAERRAAAANADLGVARAAYFPRLLLTGSAGFESGSLATWLAGLSNFWSLGPAMAATIFDGGRRRAVSAQAQAAYDESVANYRDTTLRAFEEVEDNLAALRVLDREATTQAAAVAAAERSLTLATNRYRGGVASYLEVITAQSAALTNERAAVGILTRRLTASVLLVKALGGGWSGTLPAVGP
ncbi:MAG TPA: efflux transporter outer membrane subunit [Vicinamibacterales bacterium]|nr:efflux transporter outer membrane subunit [Vicinamibacterales bacterium]